LFALARFLSVGGAAVAVTNYAAAAAAAAAFKIASARSAGRADGRRELQTAGPSCTMGSLSSNNNNNKLTFSFPSAAKPKAADGQSNGSAAAGTFAVQQETLAAGHSCLVRVSFM